MTKNLKTIRKAKNTVKVRVSGSRPVLNVVRSNSQIYAQIIDQSSGNILASASSLKLTKVGTKTEAAYAVGQKIAKAAKVAKIDLVVFNRGSAKYHGRVANLAKGARDNGLKF